MAGVTYRTAEGKILTPGSLSLQSMDEDTQHTINRANIKTEKYDVLAVEMRKSDLPARLNMTTLLVSSTMNEPSYLEKHQIKTSLPIAPGNLAIRSARRFKLMI